MFSKTLTTSCPHLSSAPAGCHAGLLEVGVEVIDVDHLHWVEKYEELLLENLINFIRCTNRSPWRRLHLFYFIFAFHQRPFDTVMIWLISILPLWSVFSLKLLQFGGRHLKWKYQHINIKASRYIDIYRYHYLPSAQADPLGFEQAKPEQERAAKRKASPFRERNSCWYSAAILSPKIKDKALTIWLADVTHLASYHIRVFWYACCLYFEGSASEHLSF